MLPAGRERLALIPGSQVSELWKRAGESEPWVFTFPSARSDWPAFGISHIAALEYAAWRTGKQEDDGPRWTYRLPTDEEWERAARGVDRRVFAWGDYLVWSFCVSHRGMHPPRLPRPVGSYPFDESPFGVRDMGGSVTEHTTGRPARGLRNTAYRGGSWQNLDEGYFRLASRNSLLPEQHYARHSGLRLVAEPVVQGSAPAVSEP